MSDQETVPEFKAPKNITELKKYLTKGRYLRLVYRHHTGGVMDEVRIVQDVDKVEIGLRPLADTTASWLSWPLAKDCRFQDDGFEIYGYTWDKERYLGLRYQYIHGGEERSIREGSDALRELLNNLLREREIKQ